MGLKQIIPNEIYAGLGTRAQVLSIKDVHLYETKYLRIVIYTDTHEHRKASMDEQTFKKHFSELGDKT